MVVHSSDQSKKSVVNNINVVKRKKVIPMKKTVSDPKTILDNEIKNKMGQLMVSVENYPQLKSNETMMQAMSTYSEVEEHIAAARRFYNSAVLDLNNAVEILPSKWFADKLGIKSELPYFEITNEEERKSINAKAYFS